MAPGDVPTSTPPLPGTWRRRKRHGPWALRPPPTLEMPHESSVPPEMTATELAQPANPEALPGARSHDPPPEAATPEDHSARLPGAFGSQLPATRDTAAASGSGVPTSAGPVASSGPARAADERTSAADLSMSIANTEIQSSVATEPSTEVLAMPATELQHPIGLLHPPDTALPTMPDTMPLTEPAARTQRLAQDLDARLAAPALQSSDLERAAQGTPGTDLDATPQTAATVGGGSTVDRTNGGRWTMSGCAQARARHTHPGSSGGPARTPHLGGMSEGGSERPSGGTAIQEDGGGASPDTQPTPLLTQVEEPQEGAVGSFGARNGASAVASAAATEEGAGGDSGRELEQPAEVAAAEQSDEEGAVEEEAEAEEVAAEEAGAHDAGAEEVGAEEVGVEEPGVEEAGEVGGQGSDVASEADGEDVQGTAPASGGYDGTVDDTEEPEGDETGALHAALSRGRRMHATHVCVDGSPCVRMRQVVDLLNPLRHFACDICVCMHGLPCVG